MNGDSMDNASSIAPHTLSGRDAFVRLLASEGVDTLFGNPGTTELAIMEALGTQSDIGYVLVAGRVALAGSGRALLANPDVGRLFLGA